MSSIGLPPAGVALDKVNADLRKSKKGLVAGGLPANLISSVETRALKSGRRQTGQYQSNRASRWALNPNDPQFGAEIDCKIILLRLLGMILCFKNAPAVDADTRSILEFYLGSQIEAGSYRDALTLEKLDYNHLRTEAAAPKHGRSDFHLGHENAQAAPKHTPGNVSWRSARSNLIQGDLTLAEARTKFVELIARYFDLGEVRIEKE